MIRTPLAVLLAGVAVLSASTPPVSAHQHAQRVITIFEDARHGTFAFLDHPPRSPVRNPDSPRARFSLGDEAAFTTRLLVHKGGARVGTVFATESVMAGHQYPEVKVLVHAVFRLHAGQIIVDAVVNERHPDRVRGAVTGGTGAYRGAAGTFSTTPGRSGNTDVFTLLPTP